MDPLHKQVFASKTFAASPLFSLTWEGTLGRPLHSEPPTSMLL